MKLDIIEYLDRLQPDYEKLYQLYWIFYGDFFFCLAFGSVLGLLMNRKK